MTQPAQSQTSTGIRRRFTKAISAGVIVMFWAIAAQAQQNTAFGTNALPSSSS